MTHPWGVIRHCPQCGSAELVRRVPRRDDRERQVCAACAYVHYVGPVLAAGLVVRDERGRFCLVRRAHDPGSGRWSFPGGFVDLDEEPAAAAVREAREETGCDATVERLLGLYRSQGPSGKPVVIAVYVGRAQGPAEGGSEEVDEIRWFEAADLPWDEFAFESTVRALRDLLGS